MRVASLHLMVKIKSIANYVKMFHTYNDSINLGIVVIFNIKTSVTLNVNDVAIIVILVRMRLTDTVVGSRGNIRCAVIGSLAFHKNPERKP